MDNVILIDHPLINHKLTILRNKETSTRDFRQVMDEVTSLMSYEITKDLRTELISVETPMCIHDSPQLRDQVLIVPVLRAGLGMEYSLQRLIPTAKVAHVGMYRDPVTHEPKEYFKKFPAETENAVAYIVDPLLATGGSIKKTIRILQEKHIKNINVVSIIGVKEGIRAIHMDYPDVKIYLASLDPILNDNKYIEPGLGDAGDRLFGTK